MKETCIHKGCAAFLFPYFEGWYLKHQIRDWAKEELILTTGNPPSEFLEDLPLFGIEREETLKKKENEGVQLDFFHL